MIKQRDKKMLTYKFITRKSIGFLQVYVYLLENGVAVLKAEFTSTGDKATDKTQAELKAKYLREKYITELNRPVPNVLNYGNL